MKDLLSMFNGGSAPSPAKAPSSRKASFSHAIKEEAAPATPPGKASADRPGMLSREKSTYALRGAARSSSAENEDEADDQPKKPSLSRSETAMLASMYGSGHVRSWGGGSMGAADKKDEEDEDEDDDDEEESIEPVAKPAPPKRSASNMSEEEMAMVVRSLKKTLDKAVGDIAELTSKNERLEKELAVVKAHVAKISPSDQQPAWPSMDA